MKHRVKLLKQGLFRKDQLNYVERVATANNIDLDKMTLKELIEFCEIETKRFINKEPVQDRLYQYLGFDEKWKSNEPQKPKPL
jgi:hypothetical protein